MRSTQLDLAKYETDKVANGYLSTYDPILTPLADHALTLLELGVNRGGSLLMWRDYFPRANVVGIDLRLPKDFREGERLRVFEGSQDDCGFLSDVARQTAPQGFEIIIDDASHLGSLTKTAFWHLFENHLKPGGLYFIEDWGTGYWDDWPDGRSLDLDALREGRSSPIAGLLRKLGLQGARDKSPMPCHSHGMVGFLKQLVDEQGAHDATRGLLKNKPGRRSKFHSVTFMPSIALVRKAT